MAASGRNLTLAEPHNLFLNQTVFSSCAHKIISIFFLFVANSGNSTKTSTTCKKCKQCTEQTFKWQQHFTSRYSGSLCRRRPHFNSLESWSQFEFYTTANQCSSLQFQLAIVFSSTNSKHKQTLPKSRVAHGRNSR